MLIINFSDKLLEIGHYLNYLDVEREFKVSSSADDDWVDLINNNFEKKLCYCFEYEKYNVDKLNNVIRKIKPDIYQNINKFIIYVSDKPFTELPQTNNYPCFLITTLINDYTEDEKEKYLFGDDFYFQFIALLNIIKDSNNRFIGGNYYGITSAGLFKEQVNEISEILNNIASKILSDDDVMRNKLLYDGFVTLKNNMENQIRSFPQNISLQRVLKFSKESVISQIQFMVSNLWKGKLLEDILNKAQKPPVNFNEGFIGQIRQKLINTLTKLTYYPSSFIVDYEKQSEKDWSEIDPHINAFHNNVFLKFLDKEKKFYISIGIWFLISALLIYLIPDIFTFGFILFSLILLLVFFYLLPRIEFKKDLNNLYLSIENIIRDKNTRYINSYIEWVIAYVRTLVEDYFEEINPKYGEVLDFLNNIPPYKIYNFNYNYWLEVKIKNLELNDSLLELSNSLNQEILEKEKKYLADILIKFQKEIHSRINDSHNKKDQFWDNNNNLIASYINKTSNYLAGRNLLKIINYDKITIESQYYCLFLPEHIKVRIPLNFSVQNTENIKTKSFIILAWIETYKEIKKE